MRFQTTPKFRAIAAAGPPVLVQRLPSSEQVRTLAPDNLTNELITVPGPFGDLHEGDAAHGERQMAVLVSSRRMWIGVQLTHF